MSTSSRSAIAMISVQSIALCGLVYYIHRLWEEKESEKAWKVFKLKAIVYGGWAIGSPTIPRSEWKIIYLVNGDDNKELNLTSTEISDRNSTFFKPCNGAMIWDDDQQKPVPCTSEHLSPDDASPDEYRWFPGEGLIHKDKATKEIKKKWEKADNAARMLKSMGVSVFVSGEEVKVVDEW